MILLYGCCIFCILTSDELPSLGGIQEALSEILMVIQEGC